MMFEAGYQEPLFVREGHSMTKEMQESIPALLRANHGVGIIGGGCEPGLPICFISELAVRMLRYDSSAEFEAATGNSLSALLYQNQFSEERFCALANAEETHLRAKDGALWVRYYDAGDGWLCRYRSHPDDGSPGCKRSADRSNDRKCICRGYEEMPRCGYERSSGKTI